VDNSRTKCRIYFHVSIGCDPRLVKRHLSHFRTSETGSSKYKLVESFDTSKPEILFTPSLLQDFTYLEFAYWDFMMYEDEGSYPLVSQVPQHRSPYLLGLFRGFVIREFTICEDKGFSLGYPRYQNAELPNSSHAMPFRGFSHRDFAICEDEGPRI